MPKNHGAAINAAARVSLPVLVALTVPVMVVIGRAAMAPMLVFILVTSLATGWRPNWSQAPAHVRACASLAALALASMLPSVAFSSHVKLSIAAWSGVAGLALLTCVAASALEIGYRGKQTAAKLFIAGMTVAVMIAVLAMSVSPALVAFRGTGLPPDRIFKASASVVGCAVPVVVLAGVALGGRWRLLAAVCVVLSLGMIGLTHSRSAMVGLAAMATVGLVVLAWQRLGWARTLVVLALAGLAAVAALTQMSWSLSATDYGGYRQWLPTSMLDLHRQIIWQFVWDRFQERPWVGWGLNTINLTPGAGESIPVLEHEFVPSHPHNWVLEVLSEVGAPGFSVVLLVIIAAALKAARRWKTSGAAAPLGWLLLWTVFWHSALANFSIWSAWWLASLSVLSLMVVVLTRIEQSRPRP